jgi:hypothetical protein
MALQVKRVPGADRPSGGAVTVVGIYRQRDRKYPVFLDRIFFADEPQLAPGWIDQLWRMEHDDVPTAMLMDYCRDHGFTTEMEEKS